MNKKTQTNPQSQKNKTPNQQLYKRVRALAFSLQIYQPEKDSDYDMVVLLNIRSYTEVLFSTWLGFGNGITPVIAGFQFCCCASYLYYNCSVKTCLSFGWRLQICMYLCKIRILVNITSLSTIFWTFLKLFSLENASVKKAIFIYHALWYECVEMYLQIGHSNTRFLWIFQTFFSPLEQNQI